MKFTSRSLVAGLSLLVAGTLSFPSAAQTVDEFYKKNNVMKVLIPVGPGSSHDLWARLLAQHMPRHIPGNPTMIVESMLGAGGLVLAEHLANAAARDGTVFGTVSSTLPAQIAAGISNVKFDPKTVGWIGSPEVSEQACAVMTAKGVKTVEDAMQKEATMGSTGPATASSYMPKTINQFIGTKFKLIEGYKDTGEIYLAMERGELAGTCSGAENFPRNPNLVELRKSGKMALLFITLGQKRFAPLPDVPSIFEYLKKPEDKQTLAFMTSGAALGRPYFTPPGVPRDRLEALRKAFAELMTDQAFLADAAQRKVDVAYTSAADLEKTVNEVFSTPPDIMQKAKTLMGG